MNNNDNNNIYKHIQILLKNINFGNAFFTFIAEKHKIDFFFIFLFI